MESMLAFKLQSLGLVQLENNSVKPRCLLYSQYFYQKLRGKET
ncbi:AAA-like domain-containing protein [Coleofasciculus sp.]